MADDATLVQLLSRWEQSCAAGRPLTAEELCRDRPDLLGDVRRHLAAGVTTHTHTGGPGAGSATLPAAPGALPTADGAGRYSVLRFHARGGLGEVYVAEDAELRREVALKCIQPGPSNDPISRRRFVREAEITGRLEHPGVVPVYGLLNGVDGRPYYAMRLVRGESLQEALQRFHGGEVRFDSLPFRQLLQRFVAVCNTIAFAHTRGVLHRDLKPHNVMLGSFGETYVVDWGLAKPVGSGQWAVGSDDKDGPSLPTAHCSLPTDTDATQVGSTAGTPAYMSPEQAAGDWDRVGPASDVFGLGATLYALLTGRPPYQGRLALTVVEDAKECRWTAPHLVRPGVPAALAAICGKAMARHPDDRYATAQDLAGDVERWLADEPVLAHREPWRVRARRWAKRHRTVVAGAVTLLLTAVAALALGLAAVHREQLQTEARRQDAEFARHQAEEARKLADANASSAAEQRALALKTLQTVLLEVHGKLKGRPGLQDIQKSILLTAQQGLDRLAKTVEASGETDTTKIAAHLELGDVYQQYASVGGMEAARAQFERATTLARAIAAADPGNKGKQIVLGDCLVRLFETAIPLGRAAEAETLSDELLAYAQKLVASFPKDTDVQLRLADAWERRGRAMFHRGRQADAAAAFRSARDVVRKLHEADPNNLDWIASLGHCEFRLAEMEEVSGRPEEALRAYTEATVLLARRLLFGRDDPFLRRLTARACNGRADMYLQLGQADMAFMYYRQAVDMVTPLEKADARDVHVKYEMAWTMHKLGYACWMNGLADAALAAAGQSLDRFRELVQTDPRDIQHRTALGEVGVTVMNVHIQRGDAAKALVAAREVYDNGLAVAAVDPDNVPSQAVAANAACILGFAHEYAKQLSEARAKYAEGAAIFRKLSEAGRMEGLTAFHGLNALMEARHAGLGSDHVAAATAAERLAQAKGLGWIAPFHAACVIGLADTLLLAGRPPEKLGVIERVVHGHYLQRGVELLRLAVKAGMRNDELIRRVDNLDPFREVADYKAMIDELARTPRPTPPPIPK